MWYTVITIWFTCLHVPYSFVSGASCFLKEEIKNRLYEEPALFVLIIKLYAR